MPKESESHPHVPAEQAQLFECHDGGSTEIEYLELLHALVRATKPLRVLETGCFNGHGTVALARALRLNGRGRLTSIDSDAAMIGQAHDRLIAVGDRALVDFVHGKTLDVLAGMAAEPFELIFFDSDLWIRADECELCLQRGLLAGGGIAAFHDASRLRSLDGGKTIDPPTQQFWHVFEERLRSKFSAVIELPLSRGLVIAKV